MQRPLRTGIPLPRLITCLRHYTWPTFFSDALAGVTVGFVALPLAMAFAIASGLSPQSGLYCAVVAGTVISALGGSRVQIGGPTGPFGLLVAGIAAKYGLHGLPSCPINDGVMSPRLRGARLGPGGHLHPRAL